MTPQLVNLVSPSLWLIIIAWLVKIEKRLTRLETKLDLMSHNCQKEDNNGNTR